MLPGLLSTENIDCRLSVIKDGIVNFYILKSEAGLLCFDTGWRSISVERSFAKLKLSTSEVTKVFLTHLHWDHAGCLSLFPQAQIYLGAAEVASRYAAKFKSSQEFTLLQDAQKVVTGNLELTSISTPGHTTGSMSYLIDSLLFTGDSIFLRRGKAFPCPAKFNQDHETLKQSIFKLAKLESAQWLLTAHSGISRDAELAFADWRQDNA